MNEEEQNSKKKGSRLYLVIWALIMVVLGYLAESILISLVAVVIIAYMAVSGKHPDEF